MAGEATGIGSGTAKAARLDVLLGIALPFVAGFVDAAGFIGLAGLFTAHVTGNFVLIGAELVSTSTGVVAKLLALPVFMLAVAAARFLALALEGGERSILPWLMAFEALLLGLCCAAGVALAPLGSPDGFPAILVGMLAVAAMGVQNALGRLSLGHLTPTTVMTVSVTQAVIDAVDRLRGAASGPAARGRLRRSLPAIVAFAVGALAGAFAIASWSFACLASPAVILAALAVLGARHRAAESR